MKKIINLIMASTIAVVMVGCGSKEVTKKFEGNINGVKVENSFTAEGDKVVKQVSKSTIKYADLKITKKEDKEKFNSMIKQKIDENKNVKGVKNEIKTTDSEAVITTEVDYTKANAKELTEKKIIQAEGDVSKGLSLEQTTKVQEKLGLKEVK